LVLGTLTLKVLPVLRPTTKTIHGQEDTN
jgi:hypothetical protein